MVGETKGSEVICKSILKNGVGYSRITLSYNKLKEHVKAKGRYLPFACAAIGAWYFIGAALAVVNSIIDYEDQKIKLEEQI